MGSFTNKFPNNLPEQLGLEEALSNPLAVDCIIDPLNSPKGGKSIE